MSIDSSTFLRIGKSMSMAYISDNKSKKTSNLSVSEPTIKDSDKHLDLNKQLESEKDILKSFHINKTILDSNFEFTLSLLSNNTIQFDIFDTGTFLTYKEILTDSLIKKINFKKTIKYYLIY